MASPAVASGQKIVLNFAWTGPNSSNRGTSPSDLDVRVVDLVFKGAKSEISVYLPENINPVGQKFPFIRRKYHENEVEFRGRKFKALAEETHPHSLSVTIEQIQNLTVKAGFFEKGRAIGPKIIDRSGNILQEYAMQRSHRDIRLEIPQVLESGQPYSLVVSSNDDLLLSARLIKEDASRSVDDKKDPGGDQFKEQMKNMGATLNRNRPPESSYDLGALSLPELQSRFDQTFLKDKEFEIQRMKAALAGNVEEMNKILKAEQANSQVLMHLSDALERKGVNAQIPENPQFQAAAKESAELHAQAIKDLEKKCILQ